MGYTKEMTKELIEAVRRTLETLGAEEEKKPLQAAEQFGYLAYVRLFIESQTRESLQKFFPYAGFPMQWSQGDEEMDGQQRIWQLQYQVQYCSSIVEAGHFMEMAWVSENAGWLSELCKLIDVTVQMCDWTGGIPVLFGEVLKELINQLYGLGTSGIFLMPEAITEMLVQMAGEGKDKTRKVFQPGCRTGEFLTALYEKHPQWELTGMEGNRDTLVLARMMQFFYGAVNGRILFEDPLDGSMEEKFDLIVTNPPVGEVKEERLERFRIATRKSQLQYLQLVMERLQTDGLAIAVVNEGILFKFDAEMKIRKRLLEEYELQGVISLPAGAFLPFTGAKASVLIFANVPERMKEDSYVWFYELTNPGYSLDRKRAAVSGSEIPDLLNAWEKRAELEAEWKKQLDCAEKKNQWENPVPVNWSRTRCWFAEYGVIRRNDYNLTAARYKPWAKLQEPEAESPMEILEQLKRMEQDTMKQLNDLIEMTKIYG